MSESVPFPISQQEKRDQLLRVRRLAKKLGIERMVEYLRLLLEKAL